MKPKIRFLVHKFGSTAPRDLCTYLRGMGYNALRCLVSETNLKPTPNHFLVNWGCIINPFDTVNETLNRADLVRTSSHKLKSLQKLKEAGVNVPQFTTQVEVATGWLSEGHTVIRREKLRAFGGAGAFVHCPGDTLPPAPLFTRYQPKRREYRVHIFNGQVIDIQQKKRRSGLGKPSTVESKIRSYGNGWVFCRENVSAPPVVTEQALVAVTALGLDFGAVDIGWTENGNKATVYEVNTAPGIEGTTVKKYAEAIDSYIKAGMY